MRVHVRGMIRFNRPGHILQIEATDVVYARPRHELPTVDDILDEGSTGGLRTEEYLERLRGEYGVPVPVLSGEMVRKPRVLDQPRRPIDRSESNSSCQRALIEPIENRRSMYACPFRTRSTAASRFSRAQVRPACRSLPHQQNSDSS